MKAKLLLTVVSAGLLLASCAKEDDGSGNLRLKLEVDGTVAEQLTRAITIDDAPEAGDFNLRILKSDGSFDRIWDRLTDYEGDGYKLKVGTYRAMAYCGDATVEGFDKPAFGVEENFDVLEKATTRVTLEAKLVNMAATIGYTEDFQGYFPEHYSVITTDAGTEISFEDNASGVAFLEAKAFKVTVYYERQNGNTGSREFNVSANIAPCKYFNITIDVNSETGVGNSAITVTFDDTVLSEPIELDMGADD